jgi:hypothetical protein
MNVKHSGTIAAAAAAMLLSCDGISFAGDYLSDTGRGDDADFGYVPAMVSF